MSDDLVKRLRGWAKDIQEGSTAIWAMDQDLKEAANRIEGLEAKLDTMVAALAYEGRRTDAAEAKLAKAVKMAYEPCPFGYGTEGYYDWWYNRHKLLAELKREDRG